MQIDAKALLASANEYLIACGATPEMIDAHTGLWKGQKKTSLEGSGGICYSLLEHAQNRRGMPNAIGNINKLDDVLFGFSAQKVVSAYPSWRELLDAIQSNVQGIPGRIDPSNPRNYWVIYAKSIMSCAGFISSFESADAFHKFAEGFNFNAHSKLALPLLLKETIFGFGFALACDFLKENGYPEFIKPDVHINDITRALGITSAGNDFGVFKDVVSYCKRNDLVPYEFDKLLWLVGSGAFYLSGKQLKTDKRKFIEKVLASSNVS